MTEIIITPVKNGYIVRPASYQTDSRFLVPETYVFATAEELAAHIAKFYNEERIKK